MNNENHNAIRNYGTVAPDKMDLDDVLTEMGRCGRFQIVNYLLISLPITFAAMFVLTYAFTAGTENHRCLVPECDTAAPVYEPSWLENAVPFEEKDGQRRPSSCTRFSPLNSTWSGTDDDSCPASLFNSTETRACERHVFDDEAVTIANEWDIACDDEWKLSIVGTINSFGQFISMLFTGLISDRIGRKKVLVLATTLGGVFGVCRSFAWSYESFLAFEFLDPVFNGGIYSTGFVLGMELVHPSQRVLGGAVISTFYALGQTLLAAIAMWLPNWRHTLLAVYVPAFLFITYLWIIPESVRWMISKGRVREASELLQKAALTNGVVLSERIINKFELGATRNVTKVADSSQGDDGQKSSNPDTIRLIFRSRILVVRLLLCFFCWGTNTFVYFGLAINSVGLGGNKYTNFMLVAIIEIPAYFIMYFVMDRFGRKWTLGVTLLIAGACCLGFAFTPIDILTGRLLLFLCGKFAITISFTVIYVATAEMFPTPQRHLVVGLCAMIGKIGSMLAPQTPLLSHYMEALPLLVFGTISVIAGFMAFLFPETVNKKLPDTIEEAENIGNIQPTS